MLDQMGGLGGLVSSTLPILVLVPVNNFYGLVPALCAAVGVAVAVLIWRLVRKENLQPAFSGFFGVAIGAAIAWGTGSAKGYFLYGIWMYLLYGIVFAVSVVVKWPMVGVIWRGINGENMAWRKVPRARRAYAIATIGWTLVFAARFVVQNWLYQSDATTALAVTRIAMGWPLTGLVLLLSVWAVRRAREALE
ncbi:DUF3159 domain-containing protein [Corynebacterium sp.]|uniref:DUF3159 domain-containing protein n=1 Tax=Corynebacterium sp. TaxID=1720 RepID=UPI0026DDBC3E|nr:DUF3159 domain-containing protein [Corynebacterium sp.]MDO5075665.1 DUF3159 domain-containing protein [Corynebacterium sp.]